MVGLVLQGGGAKGGYQIGVWKALRELNIEIGAVTGTSVGSLNASFIVQHKFDEAYDIWYNMDPRLIVKNDPGIYRQLASRNYSLKNFSQYYEYLKKVFVEKGIDITPLKELIAREVDEDKVRQSDIAFGLVTVDLTNWKALEIFVDDIEYGKIGDYMLASSFLPVFKSQTIDGKKFIDGGFYDNLPINLMSSRGYKEIIAIELEAAPGINKVIKNKELNIRRIRPSGDTGSLLEFDKVISRNNLKMGYLDTMKSFGHYEGDQYYLTNVPQENYFYERLLALSDERIMALAKINGYKGGHPRRLLYEMIVPEAASLLGLDIEQSYKTIVIRAIEALAEALDIDRLKTYTYDQLRECVIERTELALKDATINYDILPSVIRRSGLMNKPFRVKLLMQWLTIITE